MTFEAKVGVRGEIIIPEDVRAALRLEPEMRVAVQVTMVQAEPKSREPDWEKIDELVGRLGGPMREALLADGYSNFDEYIDDIRGR